MSRPAVDVVVPFKGSPAELDEVLTRLELLRLDPGDSIVVVDNTPGHGAREGPVPVVSADAVATPGYARNRGAERGKADWLVFFDADCVPSPDLLDRYFDPPPGERTALLGGGVEDEPVARGGRAAARFAHIRRFMSQDNTFGWGDWSFAQTSNAACRREAFEEVGGFRENIRAAEDADLAYRLKEAGWEIERREGAGVVHLSRASLPAFVRQRLLHGAGGAWLDRRYPGSVPRKRLPGLLWWALRFFVTGIAKAAWRRDRDHAIRAVFDPLENIAYEVGRWLRNER